MFTCMLAFALLDMSFAGREQCKNNKQGIALEPGDLSSLAHEYQSNNKALKNETASTSSSDHMVAETDQSKDKTLANETVTASLDLIRQLRSKR